jgi:hypothetical protein
MTPQQARDAGKAFASVHLQVIEEAYGPEVAAAYANGHAWAARDYVYQLKGPHAAFDMMSELADGAVAPILPEGA